jgi:hypothetical protein
LGRQRAAGLFCALVVLLALLGANAPDVGAANPTLLLGGPHAGEFQPARGDGFLAWQQNTEKTPGHYDVFARPLEGGTRLKINAPGTNGANGDIDGSQLVYQQFDGGRSDLKLFDLTDHVRSTPPQGVNTDQWEYWPSMSGDWLLFARLYGNHVRKIFLFDLTTEASRLVGKVRGPDAFLAPGQVNGDYAVWSTCRSSTQCDVVRYHIPDRAKQVIPNSGLRQHAPSVTPDGTVYYVRSRGCGKNVKIVRLPIGGEPSVIWGLPSGDDVGSTKAYVDQQGVTTFYYDHFTCGRLAKSDVWEIVGDSSSLLSVAIKGDGSGSVTSSPAGIQCGADCNESYEPGTGVVLTANPAGSSTFAGWSGACTGTSSTCALKMDSAKSVTATFSTQPPPPTPNPILTVSKAGSGTGTVTSSPPGISCGTGCATATQSFSAGTTVTLTAGPAADSLFVAWSGCSPSGPMTCTVAMDSNKSVTATFNKPVLTVSISPDGTGSGTVTSNDGKINCDSGGTGCTATYDRGDSVTLIGAPDPGSLPAEWSGACNADPCTVTMDTDKSVTATFDDDPLVP